MLNVVHRMFQQMNEDIKYVHFKSNEHLSEGLNGKTDLDLLVFEQDKEKLKEILDTLRFVSVISPKEQEYEEVEHWLGFDNDSGKLIHLHVYYQLKTGKTYIKEITLNWNEIAYGTSGFYSNDEKAVRIVSPEFEIILLMTRIICKASLRQKILYNISPGKHVSEDFAREYEFLRKRVSEEKLRILLKKMFTKINDISINNILNNLVNNNFDGLYKSLKEVVVENVC